MSSSRRFHAKLMTDHIGWRATVAASNWKGHSEYILANGQRGYGDTPVRNLQDRSQLGEGRQ